MLGEEWTEKGTENVGANKKGINFKTVQIDCCEQHNSMKYEKFMFTDILMN